MYRWYLEDVSKWPKCYRWATRRWFEQVWADQFPQVMCRKWLRFAKCVLCVKLRTTAANRELGEGGTTEGVGRFEGALPRYEDGASLPQAVSFFLSLTPRLTSSVL